jgi:hypothetical protein
VLLSGGSDTFSNLSISVTKMTINKAAVTFSGAVAISGTVTAASTALTVAGGGATLSGAGELLLSNSAANSLHGASSTAKLTNGATIRGAGHLGAGLMTLVNAASGLIESGFTNALTIDTGANTITNAGTIEALGGGGLTVTSAIANTGVLETLNGTLTVNGAVTGTGAAHVSGGVAKFAGTFNEAVSFGSTGRLVLAHGAAYTAAITGFSKSGTTSLDLMDITEATATATYSGTTASGILTVTDGTHTAHIHLTGDYTAAKWTLSADTGGGTIIVDPTAPKPHMVVAAMAGMAASPSVPAPSHAPTPAALPVLPTH